MNENEIREAVRDRYAMAAIVAGMERAEGAGGCGGCGGSCSCGGGSSEGAAFYEVDLIERLPAGVIQSSFGCGSPTAFVEFLPGQKVLDLGSGGGADALLSAFQVGPEGKVYGIDMTDEMLDLAKKNADKAELKSLEFLKAQMEDIPLPDGSIDVVISNNAVNLSTDKPATFGEAFRVLRPGGELSIADVVIRNGDLAENIRQSVPLWTDCIAGALRDSDYVRLLEQSGFSNVTLESTSEFGEVGDALIVSAIIRATKPV